MEKSRNVGLDIIRIFAAILVIICHSGFFSVGISYEFLSFAGVLAVEIFFVMSGLLVGKSMILAVADTAPAKALKKLYVNRCFRTLPLYYIMLFVTAVTSGSKIPLSCFFFCQNFNSTALGFMPVSWSLSVEAWFYFLIPPLFLLLTKVLTVKFSTEKSVFIAIGILCLIPFAIRVFCVIVFNPTWDYGIRKQIPLRLDAIMMGVFLAAIKLYYKEQYQRIAVKKACLLFSVAGIFAFYFVYCTYLVKGDNFDASALSKIFVFTLLPLFCCFLVMYMENSVALEKLRAKKGVRLIYGLSTLSYGVYLIQLSVFTIVSSYFIDTRFAISWLGFLAAIALTVAAAALTYLFIERPVIKLRNRIISKL